MQTHATIGFVVSNAFGTYYWLKRIYDIHIIVVATGSIINSAAVNFDTIGGNNIVEACGSNYLKSIRI